MLRDFCCNNAGKNTGLINRANGMNFGAFVNSFSGYGYPYSWYGGGISRARLKNFYRTCGVSDSGYPSGWRSNSNR